MKKPELLSPVGNMECLFSAIEAGCDAVYLGGYTFGARNYAGNFSNEEIIEAINYSHLYGVKVYVTVNTTLYDNEVPMFLEYVDFLHKNNVDALIIQDLGMMDLVRKTYPNLELHASTQMHIHNLEGVKFAHEVGLKRVVLARETNYELLKNIRENTNIELEVFIHGALCLSYSGQCLMSSMTSDRSGNRGTCSQPCRMKYDLFSNNKKINEDNYLLSTKDLNTVEYIHKLIDIGIDSLKIEGRMKRPEYVYLITSIYRKAIDSYFEKKTIKLDTEVNEMKKMFNRKFTKGFLFNENNNNFINSYRPNHLGIEIGEVVEIKENNVFIRLVDTINKGDGIRIINSKEDTGLGLNNIYLNNKLVLIAHKNDVIKISIKGMVKKGDKVLKTTDIEQLNNINDLIKNKKRKVKIKGTIKCILNQPLELTIEDNKNIIKLEGNIVSESINISTTEEDIRKQVSKLGSTVYEFESLDIIKDNNIFVRITDINELRRKTCLLLDEKRLYKTNYKKENYYIELVEYKEDFGYSILVNNKEEYELYKKEDIKYIYMEEDLKLNDNRIIIKLPRVNEKVISKENTLNGEIGSLYLNKGYSDFSLNVTNSYTVAFLTSLGVKRITLSYEINFEQTKELINNYIKRYNKKPNLEVIVDSYPEVMVTKYNIEEDYNHKFLVLKDIHNREYKIKNKNNLTYIYNYKKIILDKDLYKNIGINTLRIEL